MNVPPWLTKLVFPLEVPEKLNPLMVATVAVVGMLSAPRVAESNGEKEIGYWGAAKLVPPANAVSCPLLVVPSTSWSRIVPSGFRYPWLLPYNMNPFGSSPRRSVL